MWLIARGYVGRINRNSHKVLSFRSTFFFFGGGVKGKPGEIRNSNQIAWLLRPWRGWWRGTATWPVFQVQVSVFFWHETIRSWLSMCLPSSFDWFTCGKYLVRSIFEISLFVIDVDDAHSSCPGAISPMPSRFESLQAHRFGRQLDIGPPSWCAALPEPLDGWKLIRNLISTALKVINFKHRHSTWKETRWWAHMSSMPNWVNFITTSTVLPHHRWWLGFGESSSYMPLIQVSEILQSTQIPKPSTWGPTATQQLRFRGDFRGMGRVWWMRKQARFTGWHKETATA